MEKVEIEIFDVLNNLKEYLILIKNKKLDKENKIHIADIIEQSLKKIPKKFKAIPNIIIIHLRANNKLQDYEFLYLENFFETAIKEIEKKFNIPKWEIK